MDMLESENEDTSGATLAQVPSFLVAADNHDVAQGGLSGTDFLRGIAGAAAGAVIGQVTVPIPFVGALAGALVGGEAAAHPQMTKASVYSAANSFYNTGIAISNWVSDDEHQKEQRDTADWIAEKDDNLLSYYQENKQAADLIGFVGGSLVPGMGALKLYNYGAKALWASGKLGMMGAGMEEATGLLQPIQQMYLNAAKADIVSGNSAFSLVNGNVLKSLIAGTGEQMLQGAVFESAVAATMNQSPIMDGMDAGDIGTNILHGMLFAGGVGSVLEGAISYGTLRSAKLAAEGKMAGLRVIKDYQPSTPADERIVLARHDLETTDISNIESLNQEFGGRATRLWDQKQATIANETRLAVHELAQKDDVLGNHFADLLDATPSYQEVAHKVLGLKSIDRIYNENSAIAKEVGAARRAIDSGKSEDYSVLDKYSKGFMQLYGESAGEISSSVPIPSLADTLKSGTLKVNADSVVAGNKTYMVKVSKPIDIINEDIHAVEARWIHSIHSGPLAHNAKIDANDLPMIAKALNEWKDEQSAFKIGDQAPTSKAEMLKIFEDTQDRLKLELQKTAANNFEIAKRINMKISSLEGTAVDDVYPLSDRMALHSYAEEYAARMGNIKPQHTYDVLLKPQHAKLTYDTSKFGNLDGNLLQGMAIIKQQQAIYRDQAEKAVVPILGKAFDELGRIPEEAIAKANIFDASAGIISGVNAGYGSLGSYMQKAGQVTKRLITERHNVTEASLKPLLVKLQNDHAATMEASLLFNEMHGPDAYVLNDEGTGIIMRGIKKYRADLAAAGNDIEKAKAVKAYNKIDPKAPDEILFKSPLVADVVKAHIKMNGARIREAIPMRNAQGLHDMRDPDTFYAPHVDTNNYPHFAFVVDKDITGVGHMKMIHAATESELDQLINKVDTSAGNLKVVTKRHVEEFKRARQEYDADRALNENYMDATLHRAGVSKAYFPVTDGAKFTDDLLRWHMEKDRQLVREAMSLKYHKEFAELEKMGATYTELATSKFSPKSLVKNIGDQVKNPFNDYIKLALDLPQNSNSPAWTTFGSYLDKKTSSIYNSIVGSLVKTKSPEELEIVNKAMADAGLKTVYHDAAFDALVNHTAPKGVLTKFIRNANALLSYTVLGDVFNAVNNIVGMSVLTAPELRNVINAIESGNEEIAGDLAKIAKMTIPGSDKSMLSAGKLMANAAKNWFNKDLVAQARAEGAITRHAQEIHGIYDELTLTGTESVAELNSRISNVYNWTIKNLEKLRAKTGNGFAEEFTRFVAWDSMRQVTELGERAGVLDPKLATAYRNTFVNRTSGNYQASQRPLMFHGPVGQAVGLFQTYQFNLAQQLLRHVAEGNSKTSAMMLGLQGTIYGMNGLPAFQAMNTYLLGNAAGNTNHADAFTAAFGSLNKDAAEWLMYGAASNALGLFHPDLKFNLYTRGDINPRQATIIPTSFADIPAVNGTSKLLGSFVETAGKLMDGGAAGTTILQGIEHSGINRGLAGLAQSLEAFTNPNYQSFSTTNSGNLSVANDLMTLANLGRVLGGKPLAEAISIDAGFRYTGYQMADQAKLSKLGEVIKTKLIGGQYLDADDTDRFLYEYLKAGGRQGNFNKFVMDLYKKANTPQANLLADSLKAPYARNLQQMMGGRFKPLDQE